MEMNQPSIEEIQKFERKVIPLMRMNDVVAAQQQGLEQGPDAMRTLEPCNDCPNFMPGAPLPCRLGTDAMAQVEVLGMRCDAMNRQQPIVLVENEAISIGSTDENI